MKKLSINTTIFSPKGGDAEGRGGLKKLLLLLPFAFCLYTFAFAQQYGWKDISANVPGNPDFSDVFFVSDNEGWITSSSIAEIYHTTDGGETFEIQTTQFSTEALSMIDANVGYSGGTSGRVYSTSNGGGDWTPIGFISSTLTDMDFASATQGYACGNNGAVFSITPQGVTNLNSGLSTNLAGISSSSTYNVWVCGGSNIIHFDGSSFVFQSGPLGTYNAIYFFNDNQGWVVGNAGLIGHTEDGGEIWNQQINPDPHGLYDLFFLNENIGWVVGINGTIIHTIDGGETWELQAQGLTTNFLRGIHFTSPTNGYIVGNGKTLLKYSEISGIGDHKKIIDFEIFPNPTKNKIQIKCSEFKTESGTVEILSTNGKEILKKGIATGQEKVEIDLSNLESGVYCCTLKTNKGNATKKLIIQR